MRTNRADLPAFAFPVIAWAPQVATGNERDDGIRKFANLRELTRTYMPHVDKRLGWTFVDSRGCCWEAVSSKVVGRAEPWPKNLLPKLLYYPEYRLVFEFSERPPLSFAELRERLLAAIEANPGHYSCGYGVERRKELLAAESLEDVVKPDWLKRLEAGSPPSLWSQWLFWDGRASRLGFLLVISVIAAAWQVVITIVPTEPAVVTMVIVSGAVALSAIARRLHDLRLSALWMVPWYAWSWLCVSIHDVVRPMGAEDVVFWLGWIPSFYLFGCLALWPGTRGPNPYGFAPRWGLPPGGRVTAGVRS